MLLDEHPVDLVTREAVQRAVVGGVQAPERGGAGVGEPRRVLIAKDPEQAEDHVRVPGGIGDDLPRPDARLGVEQPVEDVRGVGLGAGDHDRVQPGVVVGGRAEQRDAAAPVEVAAVVGGVDRAPRNDEPQPVDRRDLAAAPALGEPELGVEVDDPGVRRRERLRTQVALRDVPQAGFGVPRSFVRKTELRGFRVTDPPRASARAATASGSEFAWVNQHACSHEICASKCATGALLIWPRTERRRPRASLLGVAFRAPRSSRSNLNRWARGATRRGSRRIARAAPLAGKERPLLERDAAACAIERDDPEVAVDLHRRVAVADLDSRDADVALNREQLAKTSSVLSRSASQNVAIAAPTVPRQAPHYATATWKSRSSLADRPR